MEERIAACFEAIAKQTPRLSFTWKVRPGGRVVVDTVSKRTAVTLWQATKPNARDFRLAKIGPAYKCAELAPLSPGHYAGQVTRPAKGYTAYFVELTFPSGGAYTFKFTTPVHDGGEGGSVRSSPCGVAGGAAAGSHPLSSK